MVYIVYMLTFIVTILVLNVVIKIVSTMSWNVLKDTEYQEGATTTY